MSEAQPAATARRAAAGVFTGSCLLAAVSAIAIAVTVPRPPAGASLRVAHHLFDASETLGVGALAAAVMGLFVRFVRVPTWARLLAYAAACMPIVYVAMGDNLLRQAALTLPTRTDDLLFVPLLIATSLMVPVAHLLGALLSRFARLRLLAAAAGVAALGAQHHVLVDDYFGIHCITSWAAATFAGASLAPLAERAFLALSAHRRGRVALIALAGFAAFGILVPPGNATRFQLFRQPCALAPWVLATTIWRAPQAHTPAPPSRWIEDRSAAAAIPPTTPALVPSNPVVVLVTIDALRAEVVLDPANDAHLPTLAEMKQRGVTFTHVSAPAGQTALSLGAVFSGRYFSELYWTRYGVGNHRFQYLPQETTPRVPEILSERGAVTAQFQTVPFLSGDHGVARGFREEKMIIKGERPVMGRELVEPALARLKRAGDGPLFLYVHLMDAHAPYPHGPKGARARERYLAGATAADTLIGHLLRLLESKFAGRWVLAVSADHGESFGDHGTFQHSKTLYEELVHVPLVVAGATLAPRVVNQRVGLVDLGPTLLDLFGAETPAIYEGQSLVPLLSGREATLDRPLIAETRLRRSLTTPEGLKVIEDLRRKTVEVYDLVADPGETRDLFDADPARGDAALATLRAFFEVHTLKKPGYRPPYEP